MLKRILFSGYFLIALGVHFFLDYQARKSYKKGFGDGVKKEQLLYNEQKISQQQLILKSQNNVIKTKKTQIKLASQPSDINSRRKWVRKNSEARADYTRD